MITKPCNKCNIVKHLKDFYKSNTNKYGVATSCKECTKERVTLYTINNFNKVKEYQKDYALKNKEKLRVYNKEYGIKNRSKISQQQQERVNNNPVLKLHHRVSSLIGQSIRRGGYTKRSQSHKILGISYKDFLIHLNNNKYEFKYEDGLYDIDHIVPISSAKTEEELYTLNHYTNLQLLPSEYNQNIKKNNKWDQEDFEDWLKKNMS